MCNWSKWFWLGLLAVALLTALTGLFHREQVEADLAARSIDKLKSNQNWAGVTFNGRDATLTGVAENDAQKLAASKLVLETYGVRVVIDQSTLPEKSDPYVFSAVKNANGIVLTGNYDSSESRAALLAAVASAMPGIALTDKLTLAVGKPEGFDTLSGFGISQLADLTDGKVNLSDLNYSVVGTPIDPPTYTRVAVAVSGVLPGGGVLKAADLVIPPLGKPYELSGSYDGATVNLTGYAPSIDASAAIELKAKELFPNKTINNALVLASGAAQNFTDYVNFGLKQLSMLENGAFSFKELDFSIKGSPLDAASYDTVSKAAKETLPSGVKLGAIELVKPVAPVIPAIIAQQPALDPTPEAKKCLEDISRLLTVGQINFESAQAVISASSKPLLDGIAAILISCPKVKMVITGHTDTDGDDNANQTLSSDRANAVKDFMLKAGIAPTRLSAVGYGETQPLVANDSPENKAKNRRIEFRLVR